MQDNRGETAVCEGCETRHHVRCHGVEKAEGRWVCAGCEEAARRAKENEKGVGGEGGGGVDAEMEVEQEKERETGITEIDGKVGRDDGKDMREEVKDRDVQRAILNWYVLNKSFCRIY